MLIGILSLINIAAFYMYWRDKRNARNGGWRTPEKALLGIAFIGGSVGALLGMHIFRHKTKHWKFKVLVPVFLMLHILIVIMLKKPGF